MNTRGFTRETSVENTVNENPKKAKRKNNIPFRIDAEINTAPSWDILM